MNSADDGRPVAVGSSEGLDRSEKDHEHHH